jgi:hypothetical protein
MLLGSKIVKGLLKILTLIYGGIKEGWRRSNGPIV